MGQFSDFVLNTIDRRLSHIENRLDVMATTLRRLAQETTLNMEEVMAVLDDLEAQVADQTTVVDSAVTLLDQIHAELQAAVAAGDPARIQAVIDKIGADKQALADAVLRNTDTPPAPPEPTPAPTA